jgi:hypothetical protein
MTIVDANPVDSKPRVHMVESKPTLLYGRFKAQGNFVVDNGRFKAQGNFVVDNGRFKA